MHGDNIYAYGMWPVVLFNTLLILGFALSFVRPKGKTEWRRMGLFMAFVVALFTEMYGVPLTIYFLSQWLGNAYPVLDPFSHAHGHLWLVWLGLADSAWALTLLHIVSNGIVILGFVLLYKGWTAIHESAGKRLVTDGIYAHVRHPQYSGLFLITLGLLIQWPTFITLLLWPFLTFAYYRLAKKEEREVASEFPGDYALYRARVPAFIPKITPKQRKNSEL
mgnify:FL=1